MMGASGPDLVVAAIGVSAVIAAGYSIHRAYKSVRAWIVRLCDLAKQSFSDAVDSSATGHLVRYHLGPNGKTTPMHERVSSIERAQADHNGVAAAIGEKVEKLDASSTSRHQENTKKLMDISNRLVAVESAQKTAASTALTVAESVEAERARRDDPEP